MQKQEKQNHTSQTGITLIALVITIIIMLILVIVTITISDTGGLFNYAGNAVRETQNAINVEQQLADGRIKIGDKWYASIGDFLKGKEMVELPEGLKVGDYVNYTPTAGEYVISSTVTGYTETTEQTFETEVDDETTTDVNEGLQWRILSIKEETGEIELVSATAAQSTAELYLSGEDGYNHAVDILNDMCKELYSNENGATARSINVEDINAKTTYVYTTDGNYGTVYTRMGSAPMIFIAEIGSTAEGLNGTGLSGSEGVRNADGTADYTTYTGVTSYSSLNVTKTSYYYIPEDHLNTSLGINSAPVGLISIDTPYWLATRCVEKRNSSSTADFSLRAVNSNGYLTWSFLYGSGSSSNNIGLAVRPVVVLGPNVSLTKDTKNSTDTTTYWNIEF